MKKVLIITYYWPPAGGPGVQRFLKIAKYVNEFGWEPIILTVRNGSYQAIDESLVDEIPKGIHVVKTSTLEPFTIYNFLRGKKGKQLEGHSGAVQSRKTLFSTLVNLIRSNFFIPDARIGWNWFARKAAFKLLNHNRIDAIITTGPPHSTHLIGLAIRSKRNIPWVVDLRDPWSDIFYNRYFQRSEYAVKKDRKAEESVFRTSDALVVVSRGMEDDLKNRHRRIQTIFNGFDESDFEDLSLSSTSDVFRLTYVGNYKLLQNRPELWKLLSRIIQTNDEFRKYFRLEFVGNVNMEAIKSFQTFGLTDHVVLHGYRDHKEALELMCNSNMLLFTTPNIPEVNKYVTGKIFEYLASRTPILAITKKGGAIEELLNAHGHMLLDFSEISKSEDIILQSFNRWLVNREVVKVKENAGLSNLSRKSQTKNYVALLDELIRDTKSI